MTTTEHVHGGLEHEALVYGADADYVAALVPELEHAVDQGMATFAVVPRRNEVMLVDALGSAARDVHFLAAEQWYRTPKATLAGYDQILRRLDGTPSLVVGEVQFGEPETWSGWTRYESALNESLAGYPSRVICPYDARTLPPTVVDDARSTHPVLLEPHHRRASVDYVAPVDLLRSLAPEVTVPAGRADVEMEVVSLRDARLAFRTVAADVGLPPERVEELTFAVNEVVTNGLVHGGGRAWLRVWRHPGGVTCAVHDDGPGSDDPFLGFRPPARAAEHGYGLWLACQLFDRSHVHATPGAGLTVVLATR